MRGETAPSSLHWASVEKALFDDTVRLVQASQGGDEAALERLFARYLPRVRQIVALRMGRKLCEIQDCDDLVQESLLVALRNLGSFEIRSEGSFRHWISRLVENRIRDAARRTGALKRGAGKERTFAAYDSSVLSDSVLAGRDPTPSQVLQGRELEERLENALLQLDERHRRVIELRRLCELEYQEIAEELGLSGASSARSLFARAMNALSQRL